MSYLSKRFVQQFAEKFRNTLKEHSPFKRDRVLDIYSVVDAINYQVQRRTYSQTVLYLLDKRNIQISESAIIYRRNLLKIDYFEKVYESLRTQYSHLLDKANHDSEYDLQMVDGSNVTLLPTFEKIGFTRIPNSKLTHGLITGIYNQSRDILSAFRFDKKYHEREQFMEAMKFVNLQSNKNTFVFDRGYWKPDIANYLLENGHDFVFRMNKINNKLIPLKTGETNDFIGTFEVGSGKDVRSIKVRYLHYTHDKHDYYIATSLFNVAIEEIEEIYKKRWTIEVVYKLLKGVCDLGIMKHKKDLFYAQNIHMFRITHLIQTIFTLALNYEHDTERYHKKNYKLVMEAFNDYIFSKLVHKTAGYTDDVVCMIIVTLTHYVTSKPNRKFIRRALTMCKKWYLLSKINKAKDNAKMEVREHSTLEK